MYKSSKERYTPGPMGGASFVLSLKDKFNMKKTVLITGASSGFGRETVKLFQQKGWNVIATMRSPEKETSFSGLSDVLVTRLDVTDKARIASAVAAGFG